MNDIFAALMIFIFGTMSAFLLLSAFIFEEVDGTVRDKYISNTNQHLLVDYSNGETGNWKVIPEVYEACEVGENIQRDSNGTIACD